MTVMVSVNTSRTRFSISILKWFQAGVLVTSLSVSDVPPDQQRLWFDRRQLENLQIG